MNNRSYLLIYLFALIGGILLVAFHAQANIFEAIIMGSGIIFLIPCGLLLIDSIYSYIKRKKEPKEISTDEYENSVGTPTKSKRDNRWIVIIPAIGGLIFGILLISMPDFFVKYLIYTFGIILLIFGIIQLSMVCISMRSIHMSGWYLCISIITILAGFGIFAIGAERIANTVTLITGIVLICYSINGVVGYFQREYKISKRENKTGQEEIKI
jgi:uncharacterized membrane protein HdeD (DUF308 family)